MDRKGILQNCGFWKEESFGWASLTRIPYHKERLDDCGCVLWFLSPSFPTAFLGNPGLLFVPDGSPMTTVGDDGVGMEPSYNNLTGCDIYEEGSSGKTWIMKDR